MPNVLPLLKDDAPAKIAKIYAEIEENLGMIPNVFQTQAYFEPLLKYSWESVKMIMLSQKNLSRKVKESIAVLVSKDNSCQYCINAHSMMLKAIGVSERELENIQGGAPAKAGFSEKEVKIIGLARAANSEPRNINASLFNKLRDLGTTDAEIVEALAVMGIFTSLNKFIDALEVAPEI